MKHLNAPMEIKELSTDGTFEGYASIFGNVDLGGDIVEKGAFQEFVTNSKGETLVLWQHRADQPIATATVKQDKKGLYFKGSLVMADPLAQVAYAHMKAGSVEGMSIGYDVLAGGAEIMKSGIRKLKALKLWEISVVTWGMNPSAGITGVKSINTIREFEKFLREEAGLSSNEAKRVASHGWTHREDDLSQELKQLQSLINAASLTL